MSDFPEFPPDLGGNAGTVLETVVRIYGSLENAVNAEREELRREIARRAENPGPIEDNRLDLEIARRESLYHLLAKAYFEEGVH